MVDAEALVESNDEVAPGYHLLTLSFEQDIPIRAGQFAMIKAHSCYEPLLRRALAVYRTGRSGRLSFLFHVLGRGTEALGALGPGYKVDALVPLGNGWLDMTPTDKQPSVGGEPERSNVSNARAIVVAGGIGSASVLMLCEDLLKRGTATTVFFGASTDEVARGCGLGDFVELGCSVIVATDDGSLGVHGFITEPFELHLLQAGGPDATVYACGPWAMMRRVAEIASRLSTKCLVSVEAPMGCGFGVCVGCVVASKRDGALDYESYNRVCIDGSIFSAESLRWDVGPFS